VCLIVEVEVGGGDRNRTDEFADRLSTHSPNITEYYGLINIELPNHRIYSVLLQSAR
jgi:hypothetical protein